MKIETFYSHLNGMEHLQIHYPGLWESIEESLGAIEADSVRTKISEEKTMLGRRLISPKALNMELDNQLKAKGWTPA